MKEWLTKALLESAVDLPEEFEGHVLGRGLPHQLFEEMRIGVWKPPQDPAPDPAFIKQGNGERGQNRAGWMSIPFWSPKGHVVGVEYRRWDGVKEVRDYRLPESRWVPVFIGLTPSALQKIWDGGDVWLVEGVFDMTIAHVVPKKDVVLACGTARITKTQIDFLARFLGPTAMVRVVFDEDETGRRQVSGYTDEATKKWVPGVPERLERVGVRCIPIRYRGGKDPGEIWEKGGRTALLHAFNL